jgi:hypothetical protein
VLRESPVLEVMTQLSTNVVGSAIPPGPRLELGQPDARGRESPSSASAVPR